MLANLHAGFFATSPLSHKAEISSPLHPCSASSPYPQNLTKPPEGKLRQDLAPAAASTPCSPPEFQGRLVSRTALPDPACIHGCACSMCNSSRRTHTSRHTQTDIVHGQKTLRSFFFFKQGYSLLRIEPDSRTGAGCLGCKLNYFNAEKPFWRHRKFS